MEQRMNRRGMMIQSWPKFMVGVGLVFVGVYWLMQSWTLVVLFLKAAFGPVLILLGLLLVAVSKE